ncbi:MAG: ribonuclease E inhibitor RraB [Acidobacteriota bacterium]|nr:ribonuclease E inhibitor RraB [Acidobacteriota bacterium]
MNSTILIVLALAAVAIVVIMLRKRKAAHEDGGQSSSTSTSAEASGQAAGSGKASKETTGKLPGSTPPSTPDDDRVVLQQLREAGSDLSKPHQIEFYLYFPTEEAAGKAAGKLEAEGFEGEMRRAPDLTRWMCLVTQQMVPELSKIAALKRRLAKLAQESGGDYDGWETNIEK